MNRNVKKKSRKLVQISILVVIMFITSVFALSHKFEKDLIHQKIIIIVDDVPPNYNPEDPSPTPIPRPSPAPPPISMGEDEEEDIPDYEFVIPPPSEFTLDEAPIITFNEPETVPFYAVEEKPELSSKAKQKLSKYIYNNYPDLALRSGVPGIVLLKFICTKDGVPIKIRIIKEDPKDMGFGQVATNALRQVKFIPGLQNDRTVAVEMKIPIKFSTRRK
ncbi:MAG: energy transducer TonB [Candidatus Delongbacteria bacterium]|nr:energy transducer TonB [Candidatus Delongbacteria bacterium]